MFSVPSLPEKQERKSGLDRADENPSRKMFSLPLSPAVLFVRLHFPPELGSEKETTFQLFPESTES